MSLIKSIKNKDQLLLDGFRYRRDKSVWRSVKDKCEGRARYDGIMYQMYQDHICKAPNPDEIRKQAEQCHDAPRLIIQEAQLKLSSDAAIIIPQYTASPRAIQRVRKDNYIPTEPQTFADIVIPPSFQITGTNQQFLLYDNNDHRRRLLIFASKEQLEFLNRCESWHCHGTFAVRPKLFEQMYSIHGSIIGKKLPLVYALLSNKERETYEELFRIINQHIQRKPKHVIIDFEKGVENAFPITFPACDIYRCFFHFKQAIWRKTCVNLF